MNTATRIEGLPKDTGSAGSDMRLYRLDPPIVDDDGDSHQYVVVSAVHVPYSGPETYIFPASKRGMIVGWSELPGSFRGSLDHKLALHNAGYRLIND